MTGVPPVPPELKVATWIILGGLAVGILGYAGFSRWQSLSERRQREAERQELRDTRMRARPGPAAPSIRSDPESVAPPSYEIVDVEDLSYAQVRRLNVRISIPEHYRRPAIEAIAHAVTQELIARQALNAISMMFFGPDQNPHGAWDVASVDWAPHGRWEHAGTVATGDYRLFRYTVSYREALPRATSLERSAQRGLGGVPLPDGATLVERSAADPLAGRDATERYQLAAPAREVLAYFSRELRADGWSTWGVSTETVRSFERGSVRLMILARQDGGGFTVMGSGQ